MTFLTTGNNNLLAYTRHHNEQTALVVLNLGTSAVTANVSGLEAGTWKLAIDVDNISAGLTAIPVTLGATQSFTVPAGGYKVYYKGEPHVDWLKGDVDRDGEVSINDVTVLIDMVLKGQPTDSDILERGDIDHDLEITINDITALIDIILKGYPSMGLE